MMEELLKKIEEELYQYCSIKYKDDSDYVGIDSITVKTPTHKVGFEIKCPLKSISKTYLEMKDYFIAEIGMHAIPKLTDPKLFYMWEMRISRVLIDKTSKKICRIDEIYPHHGQCRIKVCWNASRIFCRYLARKLKKYAQS